MLTLAEVSVQSGSVEDPRLLLSGVSVSYPLAHFGAIIGPSGCGKTSLLQLIAGIAAGKELGEVQWRGRNLLREDFHSSEIAYVPQFNIGHLELTTRESIQFSAALRTRPPSGEGHRQLTTALLEQLGMQAFADQLVSTLSGGQRRRLALGMELTNRPEILLCDEVTSGLDPQSEDDIVRLLRSQSQEAGRLVLSVTHSLDHLEFYDSVLVLFRGVVAYHGPAEYLASYFGVDSPEQLYRRLEHRTAAEWADRWAEQREEYAAILREKSGDKHSGALPAAERKSALPGAANQFRTLFVRRALIFARCRSQILLHLGFIFGLPLLVTLFAWHGLPAVENLSVGLTANGLVQFVEARQFLVHSSKLGSLISGIILFQVILMTLMGANNSGREIAVERSIFEKEKLAGLSPAAYTASKAAFLFLLVCAQATWMGFFVHTVCGFPGDLPAQIGFLLLVNGAVTSICLAISSLMRTAEQASLVSIYLVGFQLPLSGAVLALPDSLGPIIRPLVSTYCGWAGILQTLRAERFYDIVQSVVQSPLAPPVVCVWLLTLHIVAGLIVAWLGCERRRVG